MPCTHDIIDRDVAISADGMCPICQMEEIGRYQNALREIADGYGPNHGSKFCRDIAHRALEN